MNALENYNSMNSGKENVFNIGARRKNIVGFDLATLYTFMGPERFTDNVAAAQEFLTVNPYRQNVSVARANQKFLSFHRQ